MCNIRTLKRSVLCDPDSLASLNLHKLNYTTCALAISNMWCCLKLTDYMWCILVYGHIGCIVFMKQTYTFSVTTAEAGWLYYSLTNSIMPSIQEHTHTHTHTQREREREGLLTFQHLKPDPSTAESRAGNRRDMGRGMSREDGLGKRRVPGEGEEIQREE